MDEKERDIDKVEKPEPQEKIKKEIVIGVAILLVIAITYGFYEALKKPKKQVSKNETKELEESTGMRKENLEDLDMLLRYDGVEVKRLKMEPEKIEVGTENIYYDNSSVSIPIKNISSRYDEQREQYYERLVQDEIASRRANIGFENNKNGEQNMDISLNEANTSSNGHILNDQQEKKAFLNSEPGRKNYNSYEEMKSFSPYEIKAGSILPGIMITGINSDLPGTIIGNIREDVYDTVSGNYLLVPKGTRVVGTYDSAITFGQSRILIVWQRLIFPNGNSLNLENFPGVDLSGYAGITGKVNNHTFKLFQAVVLSSILGASGAIVTNNRYDNDDWRVAAAQGGGEQVISIGNTVANKILAIQPTIEVAPGSRFNVIVNSDIILTPYK
ncbi:MAG: TrbI/VirB10 family protein [Cetobacterium sp.]|uniref:TrbI/VirB10 family protein n=1 Tax=Cetobacterium sp. TaxID=2071632 RepID=UPI003F2D4B83